MSQWPLAWGAILVCSVGPALAGGLSGAYRHALENDPQHAAVQAQRGVGEERQVQGLSGLLPQISLDAQAALSATEFKVLDGRIEQRRQNRSYGLQLVQPLFRWQKWIEYQQGDLYKTLADIRAGSAGQQLILRVAEAYFEVLNANDVIEALVQLQVANAEQLTSARRSFEVGNTSIVDVHEAQMNYDSTSAKLIKARSNLDLAEHVLARITGRQSQPLRRLRDNVIFAAPVPTDAEAWVRTAERDSLDVQIKELLAHIASNEVRRRKAEHLPSIDMVVSKNMQQSPNASTQRSDSLAIGFRFSMPLYSGGRSRSSTREAVALQMQTEYELEDARRGAALAARQAWAGIMNGKEQIRALGIAMISAQSALDANRVGYRVGVRVSADVLAVQSQISDIMQQLAKAHYDALLAQLQLKATVGTLANSDLAEIDALLD